MLITSQDVEKSAITTFSQIRNQNQKNGRKSWRKKQTKIEVWGQTYFFTYPEKYVIDIRSGSPKPCSDCGSAGIGSGRYASCISLTKHFISSRSTTQREFT
jgi:hypothetical protein